MARRSALVVGVTGIGGGNIAQALLEDDWEVVGLSRNPDVQVPGVRHVHADVKDPRALEDALTGLDLSHLFFATWQRCSTEAENCKVNGAMLRNTLDVLGRTTSLDHAVLITGLKHYLGPFEAYASTPMETPFRESMPRVPYQNFYYDQEDILFAEAERQGFSWCRSGR